MDRGTWRTKEDVQQALGALYPGRRVADVDDGYLVVGAQPPPRRIVEEQDDEIRLRFGQASSAAAYPEEQKPDLSGITSFLRMVDSYDNSSDEEKESFGRSKNIVISKLNPNVKEFVPQNRDIASKNVLNCRNQNVKKDIPENWRQEYLNEKVSNSNKNMSRLTPTSSEREASSHNVSNCDKDSASTNIVSNVNGKSKSDVESNNNLKTDAETGTKPKQTKEEMANLLKSKISTKSKTFEEKMDTNKAIVNLMKLYAKPTKKIEKQPKLYTPDFFMTKKASDFKTSDESLMKKVDILSEQNTPQHINENSYEVEHTTLTPDMEGASINNIKIPSVAEPEDPYIAESVRKVNDWFDDKPSPQRDKPKTPVLYLGTVNYKRKDPVTCKSPNDVAGKKVPKPSSNEFQPSSYADELLLKYKKRIKDNATPVKHLNIWEKLEADLKKKDEEIRKRKKDT